MVELAGNRARSGKATEKHCLRELRDRRHRRRANSCGAERARGRSRSRNKDSSTSSEEGEESTDEKMEDAKGGDLPGNQPGQNPNEELSNTAGADGADSNTAGADGAGEKEGENPMKEEPNVG